ncbi:MAG: zinc dependent phospholipase C family protein [Gemmatimonadota bacterium]
MPCAGVHLHLAGVALKHWIHHPQAAPLDPHSPLEVAAFLHGAMGPDVSFTTGKERLISELSHYVRTADLARELLRRTISPEERAFAWGWVTHVEGDVALHPLVGHAVGEWIHGDRTLRMNAAEDEVRHVGMEVGLDLEVFRRWWVPEAPHVTPFASRVANLLAESLSEVHGASWPSQQLGSLQLVSAWRIRNWPRALALLARGWGMGVRRSLPLGFVVNAVPRMPGVPFAVEGFFRPLSPPEWLLGEVESFAASFPGLMDRLTDSQAQGMSNRHMETGLPELESMDHPGTRSALRGLASLNGLVPSPG